MSQVLLWWLMQSLHRIVKQCWPYCSCWVTPNSRIANYSTTKDWIEFHDLLEMISTLQMPRQSNILIFTSTRNDRSMDGIHARSMTVVWWILFPDSIFSSNVSGFPSPFIWTHAQPNLPPAFQLYSLPCLLFGPQSQTTHFFFFGTAMTTTTDSRNKSYTCPCR